jgi:FixJ family two-component response regulator
MRVDLPLPRRSAPLSPQQTSDPEQPLVIIVDDDAAVREALSELILSAGFHPISFASLDADILDTPGCLILDVRMPGASGLDLQQHLAQRGNPKPIIFLTGHGDIPMTVQAMKAGAVDFLTKPVRDQTLLDAVAAGVERDIRQRARLRVVNEHLGKLALLTPRERQVLREVAAGRLNKQIAFDLGISEITVKLHRGNVMRKMQLTSVGELVRAWETLPADVRARVEADGPHAGASAGSAERAVAPRHRLTNMASPQAAAVMAMQTRAGPA